MVSRMSSSSSTMRTLATDKEYAVARTIATPRPECDS